jgi:hypothetical protein
VAAAAPAPLKGDEPSADVRPSAHSHAPLSNGMSAKQLSDAGLVRQPVRARAGGRAGVHEHVEMGRWV